MHIDIISDTEGMHNLLSLDGGDMLIHAGDATNKGTPAEIVDFFNWFGRQRYKYKIFIPGNHDRGIDHKCDGNLMVTERTIEQWRFIHVNSWLGADPNRHILLHAMVNIDGINIFGSPYTPTHTRNLEAFTEERGEKINKLWQDIKEGVDILVTHGPPQGILDNVPEVGSVGCEDLMQRVLVTKPKVHIFGHVHEEYGSVFKNETLFINATSFEGQGKHPRNVITLNYNKEEQTIQYE